MVFQRVDLAPLRERSFRLFFLGQTTSSLGNSVTSSVVGGAQASFWGVVWTTTLQEQIPSAALASPPAAWSGASPSHRSGTRWSTRRPLPSGSRRCSGGAPPGSSARRSSSSPFRRSGACAEQSPAPERPDAAQAPGGALSSVASGGSSTGGFGFGTTRGRGGPTSTIAFWASYRTV